MPLARGGQPLQLMVAGTVGRKVHGPPASKKNGRIYRRPPVGAQSCRRRRRGRNTAGTGNRERWVLWEAGHSAKRMTQSVRKEIRVDRVQEESEGCERQVSVRTARLT